MPLFSSFFVVLAAAVFAVNAAGNFTLVGVATTSQEGTTDQALLVLDPATGRAIHTYAIDSSVGGILPSCITTAPPLSAIAVCTLGADGDECIAFIAIKDGSVLQKFCSKELVIDNIAFDTTTKKLLFNAYDISQDKNFIYNLDYRGNGTMTPLFYVPGIVQVAINAFSSLNHTFFLTVETDANNHLITLDVQAQKVLYDISMEIGMEILLTRPNGALLLWGATSEYAGQLVTVDPRTGKSQVIISYADYSSNEGCSVFAPDGKVYSRLATYKTGASSVWIVVDGITDCANASGKVLPILGRYAWILGMVVVD